ncbi:hypothetical protein ZWY2020_041054 [Hordeum vulgare]|nr:hypothetical protein ZWY2020_041054 [Hordeum vulgare]
MVAVRRLRRERCREQQRGGGGKGGDEREGVVGWERKAGSEDGIIPASRRELFAGMPSPSVVPIRAVVDGSLPCLPLEVVAAMRSQMSVGMEEMAILDATVPWSLISRIKRCVAKCHDVRPPSLDTAIALAVVISDRHAPSSSRHLRAHRGAAKHAITASCHAAAGRRRPTV